jgi:hypothetical protein
MSKYNVKHYYQPTNHSCSQTALATLLSYYGRNDTPEDLLQSLPVYKNSDGEDQGSINQQLATWCLSQGFKVVMYSADFQVLDLSWAKLKSHELIQRINVALKDKNVSALGQQWTQRYLATYKAFVETGGTLHIVPYISTQHIDELLANGPILAAVCYAVLHNVGRSTNTGLRQSKPDDIRGNLTTHSIVVYGQDKAGNYLIMDPWKGSSLAIKSEQLLCAIQAAQLECDNLLFQITS